MPLIFAIWWDSLSCDIAVDSCCVSNIHHLTQHNMQCLELLVLMPYKPN